MKMRVDRWLSTLGLCSRSEAKALIRGSAVTVNGRLIRDPGEEAETESDILRLRGQEVDGRVIRHVMMHKPAGVLTAARDKKQRTVMDLLPEVYGAICCMPVGRLDRDTTGLLIFSCDGEMNHRLLSPGRHVDKVYEARVTGKLTEAEPLAFSAGLELGDFTALPAKLEILEAGAETSLGRVTVREGKFHQVKRMFAATGHEVLALKRISFGPIALPEDLEVGAWRELKAEELLALRRAAGMAEK